LAASSQLQRRQARTGQKTSDAIQKAEQ